MSLSPDVRESYIKVIDSILAASDLNTISEKRIRKGLQENVGYDLTPQKALIKELIMERFDIFAQKNGVGETSENAEATNGHEASDSSNAAAAPASPTSSTSQKRQADSDDPSENGSKTPPKKKRKADVDADALYAAKLQAEENMRARPIRAGSTRKAAPVKKKKSKTSKKVKAEDDSDVESGSEAGAKKEVNRSGGFHKPLTLSPALSNLLDGEVSLSRPQTVKRLWQYIREHDLQDPNDRRQIRCDDAMRAVFKQDRVHMFTMTKILNQNLYNPDE
ncbi:SWIB/MDM2 domain protein [Paecilomyces variotii No. 5]|uniref:SWIB/MDM2 domain protein n=1 Tax=Byssochlamys spectabilis (strain No. 5 / NBRC 109023) TaxID=1356009 RepID=V5FZ94_BYSSN|nr:SWIB/MDM2 domain protein [Paecilomyces variotii No. 5]